MLSSPPTRNTSPQFQGRAVAALKKKSGEILVSAELAEEYGFDDIDGTRPTSLRPFPEKWG